MALVESVQTEIRPLIDAVDRVRENFEKNKVEIDLPTIAVIGNQSAGKTSLLERLSGVDLPRGEGMVTRCALVLRMVHNSTLATPYAMIRGGKNGEHKIELCDVGKHVTRITDELAKPNEISDESIYVTVYSADVPDLTLVDLPGIVYTDTTGKKSPITEAIQKLYNRYISKPGCVILCALPANVDFRTQQATAWAHEVDPDGKRTLMVVTKIDKSEMEDMQLGKRLLGVGPNAWTCKLGAVGVRNRTQAEIEAGCTRASVDEAEAKYFESHPALRALTPAQKASTLGCDALVRRLVSIQAEAIQACLPALEKAIREKLASCTARLSAMPKVCTNAFECLSVFTSLVQECSNRVQEASTANYTRIHGFKSALEAMALCRGGATSTPSSSSEPCNADLTVSSAYPPVVLALHMMPRVQEFCDTFASRVKSNATVILSPGYKGRLGESLKESSGCGLPDGVTENVFREQVALEAAALKEPAEDLAHSVADYMGTFVSALVREYFTVYPNLASAVLDALNELIKGSLEATLAHIAQQCDMECEPYTLNKDYLTSLKVLRAWQQERAEKTRGNPCFVPAPWHDGTVETLLNGGVVESGKGVAGATPAMRVLDDEDNFSQAVLDTQLKLLCYRSVVHKRFIDQITSFVRLQFPRRLKQECAIFLQRAILTGETEGGSPANAKGGVGMDRLTALMAEPVWQSTERNLLQTSITSLTKAQRELKKGGIKAFVKPHEKKEKAESKEQSGATTPVL